MTFGKGFVAYQLWGRTRNPYEGDHGVAAPAWDGGHESGHVVPTRGNAAQGRPNGRRKPCSRLAGTSAVKHEQGAAGPL